jgi:hypothetical protein
LTVLKNKIISKYYIKISTEIWIWIVSWNKIRGDWQITEEKMSITSDEEI